MRFVAVRIAWLGLASAVALATACVPVERGTVVVARMTVDTVGSEPVVIPELIRVDPEEMAERAVIGGLLGGMLGAGVGAIASPNPAIGAMIGGPAGAVLGSAIGIATTPPLPGYTPIAVPAAPIIPGFYDTWPPGYSSPPIGAQVPPPPVDRSLPLPTTIVSGEEPPAARGLVAVAPPVPR
jgi:hypothetical protein